MTQTEDRTWAVANFNGEILADGLTHEEATEQADEYAEAGYVIRDPRA